MPELRGLDGIIGGTIKCEFIDKVSQITGILDKGIAVTAAGDNGAFNIWKANDDTYRCEACKWLKVVDSQKYTNIKDVIKWAKLWLDKIK